MNRNARLLSMFCLLTMCFTLLNGGFGSIAADSDISAGTDVAGVMPIAEQDAQQSADQDQAAGLVTPSSRYGNATVNVTALNLRCGPGTAYQIVGVLSKSQPILIFGQADDWYIVYDYASGRIGFVNGYYITPVSEDSKDDPKLPESDPGSDHTGTPGTPGTSETPGTPGTSGAPDTSDAPDMLDVSDDTLRLMTLVNDIRTRHGRNAVSYSTALSKVAQDKAEDMVRTNTFSHQSALYGTPFEMMRAYGISFRCAAENIAGNQTVDGAFYAWMNSESHKENIMNPQYDRMGIGVCISPIYGKVIVQMFAGD